MSKHALYKNAKQGPFKLEKYEWNKNDWVIIWGQWNGILINNFLGD